ncbi:MAG: methylmalonyl Co-A mutase-associated GTPase MeaB [Bacteroidota bacterium]
MKEPVIELSERIRAGERAALARGITLVERPGEDGLALVKQLRPCSGNSIRIAVTGPPGAGKSTFIESFGMLLVSRGHRVAVLTVDPSSNVTGGSILGDKTRMDRLSRTEQAFIRPSPSGTQAGGVTRGTRESILLCEAAGYDVILIETVGVGQSETAVRDMTDVFLLLLIAGAGDELQGIKRGIMELADLIVVNKSDGDNIGRVKEARAQVEMALHITGSHQDSAITSVLACSALEGTGVAACADAVQQMTERTIRDGSFATRRRQQDLKWLDELVMDRMIRRLVEGSDFTTRNIQARQRILSGELDLFTALDELMSLIR